MGRVRVKTDTRAVQRLLVSARRAVEAPAVTEALKEAAGVFQRGISRRAPRRTGRLAGSFDVATVSDTEVEVVSDLVYAGPQESGAFITPRKSGGVLRFTGAGGARYLKWVRVKPQPYVAPTFASDSDEAFRAFADHVERNISQ